MGYGGGTAGVTQGSTVLARGLSTSSTGGLGNPVVSTGETGGSLLAVGLALLVPLAFGVIVIAAVIWLLVWGIRRLRSGAHRQAPGSHRSEHSPPG